MSTQTGFFSHLNYFLCILKCKCLTIPVAVSYQWRMWRRVKQPTLNRRVTQGAAEMQLLGLISKTKDVNRQTQGLIMSDFTQAPLAVHQVLEPSQWQRGCEGANTTAVLVTFLSAYTLSGVNHVDKSSEAEAGRSRLLQQDFLSGRSGGGDVCCYEWTLEEARLSVCSRFCLYGANMTDFVMWAAPLPAWGCFKVHAVVDMKTNIE